MATVAALVYATPTVETATGLRWISLACGGLSGGSLFSFLFFFPSFSLVALLCLVSFAGYCFCFLYVPFFSHRMTLVSTLTLLFWKLRIEHVGK